MNRHSFRLIVVLISLSLAMLMLACRKDSAEKTPTVSVQTAIVQQTDFVQTVEAEAMLYPVDQVAITPKVSAPVKRFYVNRGARVKKGQLLAVLEDADLKASVVENKGGLEQARASYSIATQSTLPEEWKRAELDESATRQEMEAEQKLYDSRADLYRQGALPRKDLDQAGVSLTQARNQHAVAEQHLQALRSVAKKDQLHSAQAQLDSARGRYLGAAAQLQYSEIRSPISGVVAERPLYAGETAAAGVPLLTVVDSSRLIAKLHLSQLQASLLHVGDAATLHMEGTASAINGKVTMVSPASDANSTTVEVWVEIANPDEKLRAGSSAQVSIAVARLTGAIMVSSDTLQSSADGKNSVFVVDQNSVAHQVEVKVGLRQGKEAQIVEGLKAGDKIVTTGAYGLPDGAKVTAPPPAPDKNNAAVGKSE